MFPNNRPSPTVQKIGRQGARHASVVPRRRMGGLTLRLLAGLLLAASLGLPACGDDDGGGGSGEDASVTQDASLVDGGDHQDAGLQQDAAPTDGTASDDGGSQTSGPPVIGGCEIFPEDNPWNTDISSAPVDPNSEALIASIGLGTHLHADFGTEWQGVPNGIPYVLVDGAQPLVDVTFDYSDESDPGPYPIPPDAPIEGGPDGTGDRHVLVLRTSDCHLFEMFNAWPQPDDSWTAGSGAVFDLSSNELRPDTWTSADAAGLPILPGLVRYDEVASGEIRHALRFTVSQSRRAFVHPATHWASSNDSSDLPPMGMRVRLKADFDTSGFSPEVVVILEALKKYGMFVADNGSDWFISGAPDPRWDDDALHELHDITGSAFEVVEMGTVYTPSNI